ncbi:MAG: carboxypeptidase-like regulatory domain-containing protein [Actinomycetota bacterium]|nr:carboxypeptidase-like regulatory domain-containing protein [Actinomycetota bacterium]
MILLAALVVIAVASCSKGKKAPPVSTTVVPTTTTTLVPINVPGNPRVTTTISAELQGGTAGIMGTVISPSGPVDGATVRVERFVGDTVKNADVQSGGGGRWEILGVKGGRYRVRAWRAPDMAQVQPEIFFLQGSEAKNLELRVMQFGGTTAEGSFSPSPAPVGQPATLTVLVTSATVGPDGVARVTPRPGVSVELTAGPPLTLQSPPAQVTDGGGRAAWRVQCIQPGPIPMSLNDGTATVAVRVPDCGAVAAPAPSTTRP